MKRTVLYAAAAAAASASAGEIVERAAALMGTTVEIRVEADCRELASDAAEAALCALEEAEARLSTWREDSELSALHRAPPLEPVPLSEPTARDLADALRWSLETAGAFEPGIGALCRAWNLRGQIARPEADALQQARVAASSHWLALNGGQAARCHPNFFIEEGGFGKGAALRDAEKALASRPTYAARVNLGGQCLIRGAADTVVVADPDRRNQPALLLHGVTGSVSTSGCGVQPGHLLDPRTGEPASDFGSVTVRHHDALAADAISTALFVMGPDAAIEWARARSDVDVLVLERSGERILIRATDGWASCVECVGERVQWKFNKGDQG